MEKDPWRQQIDGSGAWLCHHTDLAGNPAPATRLLVSSANHESPTHRRHRRGAHRRLTSLHCPDCGTYWRIWEYYHVAKFYVTDLYRWTSHIPFPAAPQYRSAPRLDIDTIIDCVRQKFPDLEVTQYQNSWPADDDGVWWFTLRGTRKNEVQIDSPYGMCPFLVETDDYRTIGEQPGQTIEDVVAIITESLSKAKSSQQ